MAKENKKNENAEQIAAAVSKTDLFFANNKKVIIGILSAAVLVGVAIFCYVKFGYQPKIVEAQAQMAPAEANFIAGNYETALNGDGNDLGFVQIIEDYGSKGGKSVYLYAGICELQLKNYESALNYLKKYKGKDEILSARAKACEGDAYVGLEKYAEALKAYKAAAKTADNIFAASYLLKAGITAEQLGQKAEAVELYKSIKDKYPQSVEAYDIDKYITRAEAE